MMCLKLLAYVVLFIPWFLVRVSSLKSNNTYNLHRTLLEDYDADIRPCLDCPEPLYISMEFHLTALNKIDVIEGELNTVGYVSVVWMDGRLAWDPVSTGVRSIMVSPKKVWKPPIILGNPSKSISKLNADDALARIMYNGKVIWNPGDVFRSRCEYDVYNYPFDRQRCWIVFTPWSYLAHEISLKSSAKHVMTSFYHENGEWKLGTTAVSTYEKGGISVIQFDINFIRRSEFFVVNIIVPISFLSFLNCLSFAIPIQCGERLSYSVTILLSFAVFMTLVSDNIPKTSAPMSLLCYCLTSLFSGSVLIMVCVMLNMRIFYTDPSTEISSAYVQFSKFLKCCQKKDMKAHTNKDNSTIRENVVNVCTCNSTGHQQQDPCEHVTWQDVASAFDIVAFVIFLVYFISITAGLILYTKS
ncbi:neuronal acetylcholine receptor subunit alpha-3-like [Mercenaria mercenaria]|uniref:neuronal acetylcholine receptor subunit alpha-3-like n=1 Tax=Mercenaria mercenaria TaxID=6596 RepID=UPI00234E6797|nr:neuronal acetylcholine receptor subunit alpha-3-like [Mercenaria mercenaria]